MAKRGFADDSYFELRISESLDDCAKINSNTLLDLQGELKELNERSYYKLLESLRVNGFIVPLFVWFDRVAGGVYTLDGNQRLRVIRRMWPEGLLLPYVEIEAIDKTDAKKKILLISSQYGKVTKEGFDEYSMDFLSGAELHDFVVEQTTFGEWLDREPPADEEPESESICTITVTEPDFDKAHLLHQRLEAEGYSATFSF